jgi:hypothetical protein
MKLLPVVSVSDRKKMKKENPGPRTETLLILRQYARLYNYDPATLQYSNMLLYN